MSTVCPCKGCENRSIYCHGECTEYNRWRDLMDELKKKDRSNADASAYTMERINKNRARTNKLRRRIHHAQ